MSSDPLNEVREQIYDVLNQWYLSENKPDILSGTAVFRGTRVPVEVVVNRLAEKVETLITKEVAEAYQNVLAWTKLGTMTKELIAEMCESRIAKLKEEEQ